MATNGRLSLQEINSVHSPDHHQFNNKKEDEETSDWLSSGSQQTSSSNIDAEQVLVKSESLETLSSGSGASQSIGPNGMGCAPSTANRMFGRLKRLTGKVSAEDDQPDRPEHLIQLIEDHKGGINCMEISDDHSLLVTGGEDSTIRLWAALATPVECLGILRGHLNYVTCCCIRGCHIISGSADKTLRLWSVETGDCLAVFSGHESVINHVTFEDNNFIFSTSYDKTCRVWDVDAEIRPKTTKSIESINSGYDGITVADDSIDEDGPIDASSCCYKVLTGHTKSVTQVAYIGHEHGDGKRVHETDIVVTASTDWTVRTWSLATGECLKVLEGHTGPVNCIAVDSAVKRRVYTGGADHAIKCWDTVTGDLVRELTGHEDTILILVSSNRILYSGSSDRTARAWVMEFGECTRTFFRNQAGVGCVRELNGLLYTGSCDTTARVYDAKSGVHKRTFEGHENAVTSVQPAPGRLFTGAYDGRICVWDCSDVKTDIVFGNEVLEDVSEDEDSDSEGGDPHEESENFRRAIRALDPYIRDFK